MFKVYEIGLHRYRAMKIYFTTNVFYLRKISVISSLIFLPEFQGLSSFPFWWKYSLLWFMNTRRIVYFPAKQVHSSRFNLDGVRECKKLFQFKFFFLNYRNQQFWIKKGFLDPVYVCGGHHTNLFTLLAEGGAGKMGGSAPTQMQGINVGCPLRWFRHRTWGRGNVRLGQWKAGSLVQLLQKHLLILS